MEKGEVLHLPSLDSGSWCFKRHLSHPPAPSLHLKCHRCFSKPTGIGKIAEQKQHCDTMVMVATENPSLGRSDRRRSLFHQRAGEPCPKPTAKVLSAKVRVIQLLFSPPKPWFRRACCFFNMYLLTAFVFFRTPLSKRPNVLSKRPRSHH